MRVLVAPDKFKGTLTGPAAASAIAAGIHSVLPEAEVDCLPIADGGEGTVDAAVAAGAELHSEIVTGPLGEPVSASWALTADGGAVIESAAASGLALVDPTPSTAGIASSVGTGELIRAALDAKAKRIVVGLGGVATTDGGAGALVALGARVLDEDGAPVADGGAALARTVSIDMTGLDPRLQTVELTFAVDVTNPLLGPFGTAHVFAPQKGADAATVAALDAALGTWSAVLATATDASADFAGAGAAGGLAVPFAMLGVAQIAPGFELVSEILGLRARVAAATHVITGEGSLDEQSLGGKGPCGVAALATELGIPSAIVAGVVHLTHDQLAGAGFSASVSLSDLATAELSPFTHATELATAAGARLAASWLIS